MAKTRNVNRQEWSDLDLTGSNLDRCIMDPYTFGALLLEIRCNVPTITPNAILAQFDRELRSKVESAREVFRANAESIFLHAVAERQQDEELEDDYGKPYAAGWLRRLPYAGPGGAGAIVGPAGYLQAKRDAAEQGEEVPAWSDLVEYQ